MDNKILFNKNIIKNHVICLSFMILSHTVNINWQYIIFVLLIQIDFLSY